ncbi:MAG: GAF domain-containing protein [Deltaproteobacteria bacterium]|nr:GAF domain-containing protein [Deltaproteobacteria bacterium]
MTQSLVELISNTTEAYTSALFLAPKQGEPLRLAAYHSLSQNINPDITIGPGEGLVGWVFKNNKAVNITKFTQDTRRLLFYRTDESIKSFMAVPLPAVNGVLAVDSKQRYVFTEKSQKILYQFGQLIQITLKRLRSINEGRYRKEAMQFLSDLEGTLYERNQSGHYLKTAAALLRQFVGADACFLAGVLPEDKNHYQLVAFDAHRPYNLGKTYFPVNQGLMGWVMKEKKTLNLGRIPLGADKSYILYSGEPFKDFTVFAGLPLIWGRRLQGAVCLSARESMKIDAAKAQTLEMAADRLAASLEMELLMRRISDISGLDSQTGLPHRSEFCRRVTQMLETSSKSFSLITINLSNIETIALKFGQETAREALKKTAQHLLEETEEDVELGHLAYGTFGVALQNRSETEVNLMKRKLEGTLEGAAIPAAGGGTKLQIKTVMFAYPLPTQRAEDIIYQGLTSIQGSNPSPSTNGG